MAHIRPFRAYRYDPAAVGQLGQVTFPLIDRVLATHADRYRQVPHHAVHLSVPASPQAAAQAWVTLQAEGVFVRDPLPGIYPYYQRYSLYGDSRVHLRKGFIALVRLETLDGAPTLRIHEGVLPQAVERQLAIFEATRLNAAPTHVLYHEPSGELEQYLDAAMQPPLAEVADAQGVVHQLAILQHYPTLRRIQQLLSPLALYVADGHHRLEVAQRHYARVRHLPGTPPDPLAGYHLVYLTNTATDRQTILPTHRLVALEAGFDAEAFWTGLGEHFELQPTDSRRPLYQQLVEQPQAIGVILNQKQALLRLRPGVRPEDLVPAELPLSVRRLAYTGVHYQVLGRLLGIPYAEQASSPRIEYTKDLARVIERASTEGGAPTLGLVMPEVTLPELLAVADDGARMPPKSTYFYPKVLAGLTFASLRDDDHPHPFDEAFAVGV